MTKITTLLLLLFTLLFPFVEQSLEVKAIENITNPQQVLWEKKEKIVFVTDSDIWEYTVSDDSFLHLGNRKKNEFVSFNKEGEILFCSIEHYTISSYDDFSTKFTVKKRGEEKELLFFQTIRPIYMDEKRIVAVTAMDFLETRYYSIDTESGDIKRIIGPKRKRWILEIEEGVDFKKAYIKDENMYIVEDIFGNLFLYIRKV